MAFELMGFILGKTIAEREGVASDMATKLGLLQSLMGTSLVSLLVVREVAKKKAAVAKSVQVLKPIHQPPVSDVQPASSVAVVSPPIETGSGSEKPFSERDDKKKNKNGTDKKKLEHSRDS